MKKFIAIPAILLMGLISCNSGNNSETATSTDSTAMSTDTSHSSMAMTSEANMPEAPAGATVYFKNLKNGETVSSPVKIEMECYRNFC